MYKFKADLHIHSCLSPCGSLEMSPGEILKKSSEAGLDIIALTDHNSTRNVKTLKKIAPDYGIFVIGGCEVTTREEVHCLAYFGDNDTMDIFQKWLDERLPDIKNNVDYFGYQVAVDENEIITYEEPKLLLSAVDADINELSEKINELNGICVPAHVNKSKYSVISQLGFIPPNSSFHAIEFAPNTCLSTYNRHENAGLADHCIIKNSDAHYPDQIGKVNCTYFLESRNFNELKLAFRKENGRKVVC